jgi:hypothetical protein
MSKARAALGSTGIFAKTEPKRGATQIISVKRPDREGRVPMPFWTTAPAKKQLRLLAAEEDTTQQYLMTEALNLLFQKHRKPPIA